MSEQHIELLKLIASFLTPLIILFFGILINKKLEKTRAALSKEKDWQNWWASKFLSVAHEYNSAVSEIATSLYYISAFGGEKGHGWETELKEKRCGVTKNIGRLVLLDWEIQNYLQFAQKEGPNLLVKEKELHQLLNTLLHNKEGNLEPIRKAQFDFNDAVRLVHAEILGITPGTAFRPHQN